MGVRVALACGGAHGLRRCHASAWGMGHRRRLDAVRNPQGRVGHAAQGRFRVRRHGDDAQVRTSRRFALRRCVRKNRNMSRDASGPDSSVSLPLTWCWRCGMCAAIDQATCSETPHPTGCSRSGTAEVGSTPARVDRFLDVAKWSKATACKAEGRKPASVRIGSSSPGPVGAADKSSRLRPGGAAIRISHEAPDPFPVVAGGRAPGC